VIPAAPLFRLYFERNEVTTNSGVSLSAPSSAQVSIVEHVDSGLIFPIAALYLISGVYVATVLFFLIRLGWMIRRTAVLIRNATPAVLEGEYAELWRKSAAAFAVRGVVLRCSPDISSPVAAGFRRPVLLLPDRFIENHSPTEFLAVAGHECAHIQRNDFWKNVLYEAASVFICFHPLTWAIKARVAQTREMICDGMAAYQLLNRRTYAELLLHLASKMRFTAVSPAVGMFDTDALERRIMELTSQHKSKWGHASAFAAALVLFGSAAASWALAQTVAAQTNSVRDALLQRLGRQDLSCTYYGKNNEKALTGRPGTCWLDENEKELYRCYLNEHPEQSDAQTACEWKVQRALKAGK
jgi:beta-lactamase regulating signal transducer with metallopeptidase domain